MIPKSGHRFPACAKPWRSRFSWTNASAGVGWSERIMRQLNKPQPLGDSAKPCEPRDGQCDADRRRTHVLDAADIRMMRGGDVIGKSFDRTIEQLDRDEQQNDAYQREALPGERRDEPSERNAERKRDQLFAERGFGSCGNLQPAPRIQRRMP